MNKSKAPLSKDSETVALSEERIVQFKETFIGIVVICGMKSNIDARTMLSARDTSV